MKGSNQMSGGWESETCDAKKKKNRLSFFLGKTALVLSSTFDMFSV